MIKGQHKYRAKKAEVDGITFDSLKEANRYKELKLLERAHKIYDLQLQVPYVLIPAQYDEIKEITKTGKEKIKKKLLERECKYVADFVYKDSDGETVVEDVKGLKRGEAYHVFSIKRKLMLFIHGIRIMEI